MELIFGGTMQWYHWLLAVLVAGNAIWDTFGRHPLKRLWKQAPLVLTVLLSLPLWRFIIN